MVAAVFTAEVEGAFTAEVEEGDSTAGEEGPTVEVVASTGAAAGSAEALMARQLRVTAVLVVVARMLRDRAVSTQRGPAITILGLAVISREEISGMEILPRLPLLRPTDDGIHLAGRREAVGLRARKGKQAPPATPAASMYLAGTAEALPLAQCAAFRARAAKFGRILLREILFPDLNRFPPFTIPSTVHSLRVPDSARTRCSVSLRAWPVDRRLRSTADFRAA